MKTEFARWLAATGTPAYRFAIDLRCNRGSIERLAGIDSVASRDPKRNQLTEKFLLRIELITGIPAHRLLRDTHVEEPVPPRAYRRREQQSAAE